MRIIATFPFILPKNNVCREKFHQSVFCKDYPTSCIGEDFMTRWAMYATTPMSSGAKRELYPVLKQFIKERPLDEAVDIRCRSESDFQVIIRLYGHGEIQLSTNDFWFFAGAQHLYHPTV